MLQQDASQPSWPCPWKQDPRTDDKASLRHFTLIVSSAVVFILAVLAAGTWLLSRHNRASALRAAEGNLRQASLIVESVVNHQFLQVDGALASLPDLLGTIVPEQGSPEPRAASRLLRSFNFQTFAFRDIMLLRPDGTIWASARPNAWNHHFPLPLADQDPALLRGAAAVLGPVRNAVTGDWVVFVTRQVTVPGAGPMSAAAELPLPIFSNQFAAVGGTPGLRVFLQRHNGILLVCQPYNEIQVGKPQPIRIGPTQLNGQPFAVPAELAGAPTLAIARPSLYADVLIVLTLDLDAALADWKRDRDRLIIFSGSFATLICALALTLDVAHRQRGRAEAERNRARAMLDSAIESMSEGFVMWDSSDRLVTCNEQFRRMYDRSRPFIIPGAHFEDIIREGARHGQYPSMGDDLEAFVRETLAWHLNNDGPLERELPDGRWVLITERRTPDGGIVGIRTDITNLKAALAELADANERAQAAMEAAQQQNVALRERDRALNIQNVLFDAALNNMSQGLLMTDANQRLIIFNRRFVDLFGIDAGKFSIGLPIQQALTEISTAGFLPDTVVQDMLIRQRVLADARQSGNFLVTGSDGFAVSVSQRPIADGGWLATYEDVTERHRAEEKVRYAAHHDALTGLPNRVLFHARLAEMIERLRHRETGLALLCLDLDRFKQVNDTLGHPIGDRLLDSAGRRLMGCVKSDSIVARLGGDEFAIAFVAPDARRTAEVVADRIIAELSTPYSIEGHMIAVSASVGIVIADGNGTDADTLLKNADMALYQAKSEGRGVYSVFESDMERQLLARLAIEEDLSTALDRGEFELYYQPLYDLGSHRISGFEALLRWIHPRRGIVSPAYFVRIAEETGMIRRIGSWVIQQACEDALRLPPDVKVAVNLSPVQFQQCDIVGTIARALSTTGLPANRLELEITESTLLESNAATLTALFHLRSMGLRVALDDFGTGYSSLSYLRRFPFDKIKIDRSFVCEMEAREDCAAIVMSIVTLANRLGITTTAEGVETLDQLWLVREAGCTEAQGYLFSQPMPLREVLTFFDGSDPLRRAVPQAAREAPRGSVAA
ncbi:EAL domain-containing protein [Rhodopila sp.]|jgi:diguanylate cyclase (GGDEF)-like protein|uniref:EAL domain-containing protein n=1 Tax=Rhodopila sp. TaxID=2480087 RepID=UPI002BC9D6EE|nr:EAL domain-containing protein [Rhodopila sp.]HVZ06485.1 EAL domain-containing protein [Rhodopila sp.]